MKRLTLALSILFTSLTSAADKPAHLFILTGQSNMAGMDPKLGFEPEAKKLFPEADVAYIKVAVGGLRREDVPDHVDWLLLDVNLAPQVALHQIKRIVPMVRRHLRGAFFTLKLNEEAFAAEIPAFLERIRGMALPEVRATQLPANRKEICVYASRAGS